MKFQEIPNATAETFKKIMHHTELISTFDAGILYRMND